MVTYNQANQVCNKGGRQFEHQILLSNKARYQAKEFSVLLYLGRCKPLCSLNSFLSRAPQLCLVIQSCLTLCNPMECSSVSSPHQSPLSMGFSRQEYHSGLPFPPPGDLPNTGIKPSSRAARSSKKSPLRGWKQFAPGLDMMASECHHAFKEVCIGGSVVVHVPVGKASRDEAE